MTGQPNKKEALMSSTPPRKMIAALRVSLDGFIEGPDGEKDWADSWADAIELIPDVDTFVLARGCSYDEGRPKGRREER
jgi:hypothetical protein